MKKVVMSAKDVRKTFHVGAVDMEVLKGVSIDIIEGEFFVIFGPSGSGKSTLLHSLLGLERPTEGQVKILDEDCYAMSEDDAAEFRKSRIGMVYQQPYWIKSLSVAENVAFPMFLLGQMPGEAITKAVEMLEVVGMEDWHDYSPMELSAGQQQRVSVARALINNPLILVADEPTGNLDTKAGEELMQLLTKLNKDGRTVVMVTHDLEYMKYASKLIRIVDGKIDGIFTQKDRAKVLKGLRGKRGSISDQMLEVETDTKNTTIGRKKKTEKLMKKEKK